MNSQNDAEPYIRVARGCHCRMRVDGSDPTARRAGVSTSIVCSTYGRFLWRAAGLVKAAAPR